MALTITPIPEEEITAVVMAVIYTRVSLDKKNGRSVGEQEEMCRAVCERNGWPIYEHVYTDNSIGASRHSMLGDRPEFKALMQILKPGWVIVNYADNRLHRSMDTYVDIRRTCEQTGAMWCYGGRLYDMRNARDRTATAQDALRAEGFVEDLREAVLRESKAGARQGRPSGRPPFGYRVIVNKNGVKSPRFVDGRELRWEPDPEDAPRLMEAADRILAGEPRRRIQIDFEERGILGRDGKPLSSGTIRSLLMSPTMAGYRVRHGDVVAVGMWEPIFSEEMHLRLVRYFKEQARKSTTPRGSEPRWMLVGIATCGVCGATVEKGLGAAPVKGQPRVKVYYCSSPARCVSRTIDFADGVVGKSFLAALDKEGVAKSIESARVGDASKYEELGRQAQRKEEYLRGYIEAATDPDSGITPQALGVMEKKLRPEIEELYRMAQPPLTAEVKPLQGLLRANNRRKYWDDLLVVDKKRILRQLLDIKILPSPKVKLDASSIVIRWHDFASATPSGID